MAETLSATGEPLLKLERQCDVAYEFSIRLFEIIEKKEIALLRDGISIPRMIVEWREPGMRGIRMAFEEERIRRQASPERVDVLLADLRAKRAERDRLGFALLDAAHHTARDCWHEAKEAIQNTPAVSLAGVAVKLRVLRKMAGWQDGDPEMKLAKSALADLERFA